MSTSYGRFTSKDGKPVYADASEIGQRISLCGEHDFDEYFAMGRDEADKLLLALSLAYAHNRWLWFDPLGDESERNAMLVGALRSALNQEPCWEDTARAALHNAGAIK